MEQCCNGGEKIKLRTEEEKKALTVRISRLVGQLNGIKRMVEEDRYCSEIIIQLSAADKAVKSIANVLLDSHMHTCLVENIQQGNLEIVDEIVELFKRFQ